ncbi:hypothetical protein [Roseibium aggregatum]|uniref:Uncharacterized protein n=1 Tax=Roseibium aggregatum TaxID=187304 RepID=A0A926P1W2_9HYPH|nr:hypothetical protein [Roseibium aggregatum]MBD1545411.1 hypothetical protein [Roseibium aggregatum]
MPIHSGNRTPVRKWSIALAQGPVLGLLVLWAGAGIGSTFDKPKPRFLQSGANDVIRLQRGDMPDGQAAAVPRSRAARTPSGERIDTRLVTVCLANPANAHGTKAFDIQRTDPPRFVAKIGTRTCARFEPTRHTLYLWKAGIDGKLSLILSSPLDLNDADGTQVSLDWLQDR